MWYRWGAVLLASLATSVGVIVSIGFVLSVLWRWFVVPLFKVPDLTIVQAIGLSIIVRFLNYHDNDSDDKEEDSPIEIERVVTHFNLFAIVRPFIFLAIGYIVHLFL